MRLAAVLLTLLPALSASADVLVLKDGRKLIGRVRQAKDQYEVTIDGQKQVFAPDDVQKVIKSPREIVGDADKQVDAAKQLYQQAVGMKKEPAQADKVFRNALAKVEKARDAYAEARDLFPDGYSDLDKQLMTIMMLMRLIRSRLGSQIASGPPTKPVITIPDPVPVPEPAPVAPTPAGPMTLGGAIALIADPAKRDQPVSRNEAVNVFSREWRGKRPRADLGAAGYLLLSVGKGEEGAPLGPDARKALDEFLVGLKEADVDTAKDAALATAAGKLAARIKELRSADPKANLGPLEAFAAALASCVLSDGEAGEKALEPALTALDYRKSEYGEVWGTKEALAMDDFRNWMKSGDFGLAVVQFKKDYRGASDFTVAYADALLQLFKAVRDNRLYNTAAVSLELLSRRARGAEKDHVVALAKSIRANSPCASCGGTGKINCSACKGKKKLTLQCRACGGSGKILDALRGGRVRACRGCGGKGMFRNVDCPKCKVSGKPTGKATCRARRCAGAVKTPTLETFAKPEACSFCGGAGLLMNRVAYLCPECHGVGLFLHPRTDPDKTLR